MFNCCGKDWKSMCDQFECKVTETQKGIQIDITAKDGSKTESLKALAKACKDFCGCCQFNSCREAGAAIRQCYGTETLKIMEPEKFNRIEKWQKQIPSDLKKEPEYGLIVLKLKAGQYIELMKPDQVWRLMFLKRHR